MENSIKQQRFSNVSKSEWIHERKRRQPTGKSLAHQHLEILRVLLNIIIQTKRVPEMEICEQ